ncbi:40S ribosomal protein Sa-2-like isoform X1 [Panicum virgatum]|uniref:40S ribosomal protein Sa-2-like isoform X1 n=1 Tax=Panicum virgatum TaxID=38727 RepID=UPI0019D5B836|nr:40S ribosomal protein Sa-2-like isoform X1 [Panicum virgatum]
MAAAGGGGAPRVLSQKEQDIQMMLAADVQLGTKNCDFQMERYVFKRRTDGIYIINLGKTWEKLQLAARVIVAIENPQDIIVQSARPYGQRAVLKFAQYTGAHAIAGRHTPGTFTNQLQTSFSEPRLLILTDPRTDHQPIKESALGNIPTIAFCDTDSPMRYVDIGIPANNKGRNSIGCLFWLLARMVLQMRGTILPGHKWEVMVCKLRMLFKLTLDMQCVQIFYYPCILMCYAVCRLICSSIETLRKQRSTRRKLLLPLTLPLSLIIQRLISGVETSGPLMLLHRLLLLVALVRSGVLLQLQFLLAMAGIQLGPLHLWRVLFLRLLLLRLVGTQQHNPPPKAGSRHRPSLCDASCGLN